MKKPKSPKAKKKGKPARLERRVRVTFFLPAGTKGDQDSARKIAHSIGSQFLAGTITRFTVTGFTHSGIPSEISEREMMSHQFSLEKEIFWGHWWSYIEVEGVPGLSKKLVVEPVVFFLIDYPSFAQEWELDEVLQHLKEEIFSIYAQHGRPQEEIWMVKQDIYRYA